MKKTFSIEGHKQNKYIFTISCHQKSNSVYLLKKRFIDYCSHVDNISYDI